MLVTAAFATVGLSEDGICYAIGYSFFRNSNISHTSVPTPISNLPKIKEVSCGGRFCVCLDEEGYLWSFGYNSYGQLGMGNRNESKIPKKIPNIPCALSISCGDSHVLFIAEDSTLWSFGSNNYGQLCYGNKENLEAKLPLQAPYSNITKICAGYNHSFFQNDKEEIFGCGSNESGNLGLGTNESPQIKPLKILNQPPNIIQISAGDYLSLFLDIDGNVFYVGTTEFSLLGFPSDEKFFKNVIEKIPNIPQIQKISCGKRSNYLLDYNGDIWSFGENIAGQLGHGDTENKTIPTKISFINDIQQIASGCSSSHCFVKNSQNEIFAFGSNTYCQVGSEEICCKKTPERLNPKYFSIWGESKNTSRAKSARK